MDCPRCKVALKQTDYGEVGFAVVDVCPECHGMWLDKGELDTLDDSIATNAELMALVPAQVEHETLSCPRCGEATPLKALSPPESTELVIDRCSACEGFWLDHGELDHVRTLLLNIDSDAAPELEHYTCPAGWSRTKWTLYKLWKAYQKDIETVGKAASYTHTYHR